MGPIQLFYSWQSDRDQDCCRNFIKIALQEAISEIQADHSIEIHLDSDTEGVPGTPHVSETILGKIKRCDIFVGDLTFVGETAAGKRIPNPNVLIEFGYARGVLSDAQIMSVMNTAFGQPKDLPFDLVYLRYPSSYSLSSDASRPDRREARTAFASRLVQPLKLMAENVLQSRAAPTPAVDLVALARARIDDVIAMNSRAEVPVLVAGARLLMQVAPIIADSEVRLLPSDVTAVRPLFIPAGYKDRTDLVDVSQWADFDFPRAIPGKHNDEARWYTRLLNTGILDTSLTIGMKIDDDPTILVEAGPVEARIVEVAKRLGSIVAGLGLDGPIVINAALQGVEDTQIMGRHRAGRRLQRQFLPLGSVVLDNVAAIQPASLRPMLEALWRAAASTEGSPLFLDGVTDAERAALLASPVVIDGRSWR